MADEPNKDDETPIEIVEEGGAPLEVTTGEAPKEPEKIVSGEEGAEELRRRLDDANARATAAEGIARAAVERTGQAVAAVEDGELREIETSIAVTKRNMEIARQQYRTARANNDVDAELDATEALAQSKADMNALEAGKAAREHAKQNPQPQPQFRQDPVEVVAHSLSNWPKSAEWIRAHPEMARDPNKWAATRSASDLALARGLKADTPEYFAHIEGTLQANGFMPMPGGTQNGNGNGAVVKTEETAMSQASRPVPPAAAPPSRSGGAGAPARPGTIRLTREQAEIAELSFPGLVKEKGAAAAHRAYAQSMVDAKANGKIN